MHKQFYFLAPVEVVKVTSQNIKEVAEWCGGEVAQTESRRVPGRMDSYVWVPTPKGTAISWAFPGMFITKRLVRTQKGELRATWAVYRRDYFEKNYFDSPKEAVDATWELEDRTPKVKPNIEVHVHVKDAMSKAVEEVKESIQENFQKIAAAATANIPKEIEEAGAILESPTQVEYVKGKIDVSEEALREEAAEAGADEEPS